jgi:hypothetical protein
MNNNNTTKTEEKSWKEMTKEERQKMIDDIFTGLKSEAKIIKIK